MPRIPRLLLACLLGAPTLAGADAPPHQEPFQQAEPPAATEAAAPKRKPAGDDKRPEAAASGKPSEPPLDAACRDVMRALRDGKTGERTMAVSAIRGFTEDQMNSLVPPLLRLLASSNAAAEARSAAAAALADLRTPGPAAVDALFATVRTGGKAGAPANVREMAARTLLTLANRRPTDLWGHGASDALLATMSSAQASGPLREAAAAILSLLPGEITPGGLAHLVVLLRDRKMPTNVRGGALLAIAGMGGAARSALPALRAVEADASDDDKLRATVRLARERIESPSAAAPAAK